MEQLDENLDVDKLYDMIADSEETKEKLNEYGIKEKDIKEAIDFQIDTGILEVYINGTTKVKGLISMFLDSKEFENTLNQIKDGKVDIDEDNVIESLIEVINGIDEISEYGLEFVEIK